MKIDVWFDDGRCSRCYAPALDGNLVIEKEDEPVWAEYLTKKIGELLTPDAIDTPEFKAADEKVRKDRERALRFELRREKEREDYQRRKVMSRPKITFIPKGLLMDYYFVLREYSKIPQTGSITKVFEQFGLERFASAVMWIMKYVFGMEDKYLFCEPNEEEGRFILNEVMQNGNFGHHDE